MLIAYTALASLLTFLFVYFLPQFDGWKKATVIWATLTGLLIGLFIVLVRKGYLKTV